MHRVSNQVLVVVNLCVFLVSLSTLVVSSSSDNFEHSHCLNVMREPMLLIGIFLFIMSVMGIIGSCWRISAILWIYLLMLLLLMIGLFIFTIFVYIVTDKHVELALEDTGSMQHRIDDYSNWLRKQLGDEKRWEELRGCLHDGRICEHQQKFRIHFLTAVFDTHNLTQLQAGCCRPPSTCGYTSINLTFWVPSENAAGRLEGDCKTWSNDQKSLCYNCDTCRKDVLENMQSGWRRFANINFVILVFLGSIYGVGCCAYRTIELDRHHNHIYYY